MTRLTQIVESPSPRWPGTSEPVKRIYTGIPPIDGLLFNVNPFFAPVIDGSDPSLSLWSIFMSGQYGAGWCLTVLESLRRGNEGKFIRL